MKTKLHSILIAAALFSAASSYALNEIPDDARIGGLALGCQAYTFHRFTAFEAIEKTAQAGGRVIELFPGQKLAPDSEAKLDHNATDEIIATLQAKLKQHNIRAVNYGVVRLPNDEAECRKIFLRQKTGPLRRNLRTRPSRLRRH